MIRRHFLIAAGALALAALPAHGQTAWPTKTVRLVVPYPGGGGIDVLGRVLAERLQAKWGQPVIIENRAGGSGIIGVEAVTKAEPDGHTLLLTTDATHTINPHLFGERLPYKPMTDLMPIVQLVTFAQMLVANPGFGPNSVPELVAWAKANPGKASYGSYGSGSQSHLATEMLKNKAGIDILHVAYRGLQPAVTAAMGGEIQLTWTGVASGQSLIRAGRLKALAIGGEKRPSQLPDVPTFKELGYPDVDSNVWFGMFAPRGTPPAVVQKVYADIAEIMRNPELQQKEVAAKGYDWAGLGPADFAAYLEKELASRAVAVRISGAKPD